MMIKSSHIDDRTDWGSDTDTPSAIQLGDVEAAAQLIKSYLSTTPLVHHPRLDNLLGAKTHVKLENAHSVGAFKIRGALNLIAGLDATDRSNGIVTATRGNHGAALAQACSIFGVPCTVFVPEGNNPDKNAAMTAWQAELIVSGHDFDAAWDASVRHAKRIGALSVHPAKSAPLVAGQGTVALEMLNQSPAAFDTLFVPVGGGSIAASTAIVLKALSPDTRLIAVQAENAPAFHNAWHTGKYLAVAANETIADGLASRIPVRYTLSVLQELADDFLLVSEEEIAAAIRVYAGTLHQLAEGAGAAPLAGALQIKHKIAGQRIGIVLTGGNIDAATLARVMRNEAPEHGPLAMPHYPIASLDYGDR